MARLIGFNIFSILTLFAGLYFIFFPQDFIAYPDKKAGGLLIILFALANLIFINSFGRAKLVRSYKAGFFYLIELMIIIGLGSCILGFMGLFTILPWYDTLTHFLAPMLATIMAYFIYCGMRHDYKFNFATILVFSLAMIGLIFLWEFAEFVKEQYTDFPLWLTNGDPNDFRDDIIAGFAGIAAGTLVSALGMKKLLAGLKNKL